METFIIDVPVPSMGATVYELNVIVVKVQPGERVTKGQRLGDLESDKSTFEFESPCDGTVLSVSAKEGQVVSTGQVFCRMETSDESQRHLTVRKAEDGGQRTEDAGQKTESPVAAKPVIWTPRATKLAQEAGLDPAKITDIAATGPGNRVSGDDVVSYLAKRKG